MIEEFTGYSKTTILQDFYCTLFLSNIQSLLVSEANEELKNQGKNNKMYEYKPEFDYRLEKNHPLSHLLTM